MTIRRTLLAATAVIALAGNRPAPVPAQGLGLGWLAKLANIDARYQGYNIEMVEVTGGALLGTLWRPSQRTLWPASANRLCRSQLVAMAKALGPSFLQVSGTWANNTYLKAEGEHLRLRCGFMRSASATGPAELQSWR